MYKELKALGLIKRTCELYIERTSYLIGSDIIEKQIKEALDTIEQALKRLEAIDNSNPSEALKDLKELHELAYGNGETSWKIDEIRMSSHIKQALIKAQEQKKVLEIIKEKDVNFEVFGAFETYKDYEIYYNNKFHLIENKLTEEEFDLLKRYLDNEH